MLSSSLVFNLRDGKNYTSLAGNFLVASPYCSFNDIFSKSLVYVASHNRHGAVGLIVNHFINQMSSKSLLKMLKEDAPSIKDLSIPICLGGPVDTERGFVLHTVDYNKNILFKIGEHLSVSSNVGIIKDIITGQGPVKTLFIMGYTGWEAGQLEREIENNFWIVTKSSPDLIFNERHDLKWKLALQSVGIQTNLFSSQVGHA